MEDKDYIELSKAIFNNDPLIEGITFNYDGSVKNLIFIMGEEYIKDQNDPIYICRKTPEKVFWNGVESKNFNHIYVNNE